MSGICIDYSVYPICSQLTTKIRIWHNDGVKITTAAVHPPL